MWYASVVLYVAAGFPYLSFGVKAQLVTKMYIYIYILVCNIDIDTFVVGALRTTIVRMKKLNFGHCH